MGSPDNIVNLVQILTYLDMSHNNVSAAGEIAVPSNNFSLVIAVGVTEMRVSLILERRKRFC